MTRGKAFRVLHVFKVYHKTVFTQNKYDDLVNDLLTNYINTQVHLI